MAQETGDLGILYRCSSNMMMVQSGLHKVIVVAFGSCVLVACQTVPSSDPDGAAAAKIAFDLMQFDENGLYGPADGKRSLDYEFCIPAGETYSQEVMAIDPSLTLFPDSPGRIGCTDAETLAIGNTHQENFQLVLLELANLDYVERIQQVNWE
ncbi:MAG: hypothetical protein LPK03_10760 [Pontibacter sp.]|nr:hypothetical protein [Pontibacter sp.]